MLLQFPIDGIILVACFSIRNNFGNLVNKFLSDGNVETVAIIESKVSLLRLYPLLQHYIVWNLFKSSPLICMNE